MEHAHNFDVFCLQFEGDRIVSGSSDSTVKISFFCFVIFFDLFFFIFCYFCFCSSSSLHILFLDGARYGAWKENVQKCCSTPPASRV